MARLFGTDGVRGKANVDITAELALDLSVAAAHVLCEGRSDSSSRPVAVVGRDTRVSGLFLSHAVIAGLASAGVDVIDVGVLPTPGVAHLVAARGADLGVMLSASHNAMPDNGIKFFSAGGHKLPDEVEDAIASRMREEWQRPVGGDVGRVETDSSAGSEYVRHVVGTISHSLAGMKVVVDCAHGAASLVGPAALRNAGAQVIAIAAEPDGLNINDRCGSTHLDLIRDQVALHEADAGIAFDGDADRCLAVAADGSDVDGDQIMGLLAEAFAARGDLKDNVLVTTVMSNLGLKLAMKDAGISCETTAVGDRYVLERLRAKGYSLGGEQSGHVVMPEFSTTGDGVLTALHLLSRVNELGVSLADAAGHISRLPQVMINVPDVDKARAATDGTISAAVKSVESELGESGRVLLRPSGTEPVVRVMVEAADQPTAVAKAEQLADVVRKSISLA